MIQLDPVIAEAHRLSWTMHLRPNALGVLVRTFLRSQEPRTIVHTSSGLKLYIDPLSKLGSAVLQNGEYEPETCRIISDNLRPGEVFIDIGANEGALSCFAARVVGPQGTVIAVEPQHRLRDILEINFGLNSASNCRLIDKALTDEPVVNLNLWPSNISGASSLVRTYRWGSNRRQAVAGVSFGELLQTEGVDIAALVKVDVEGYEAEVVDSMLQAIQAGKVGKILVDYHGSILRERKIDPVQIDRKITSSGMRRTIPAHVQALSGYALYVRG